MFKGCVRAFTSFFNSNDDLAMIYQEAVKFDIISEWSAAPRYRTCSLVCRPHATLTYHIAEADIMKILSQNPFARYRSFIPRPWVLLCH